MRYSLDFYLLAFLFHGFFVFVAEQLVLTSEHDLRIEILSISSHLNDILVELNLFLSVRDLVHASVEHEYDAVRLVLDALSTLLDGSFEELVVSFPEFPKKICIPILALLDLGLVFDLALNQQIELVQLIDVHPDLPSRIVHLDLAGYHISLFVLRLRTSSFLNDRRLQSHSCEESSSFVFI